MVRYARHKNAHLLNVNSAYYKLTINNKFYRYCRIPKIKKLILMASWKIRMPRLRTL
jgi:hypothetical protein